jgi:uncharacterized membrane protein
MYNNDTRAKESGVILLALFALIIIGIIIAAFLFVLQQQRKADGHDTQIKIEKHDKLIASLVQY